MKLLVSAIAFAGTLSVTAAQNFTDYAYVYFAHETPNGEQVRMAVTNNGNLNSWQLLKGGNPYLTTTLGTKGIRDPSLIISPDRSKFWIIATDLCVYCAGGWGSSASNSFTTQGSKSIQVWESTDRMKTWTGPVLRQVTPQQYGMTWAPDAIWDPVKKAYKVFWTSAGGDLGWGQLGTYTTDFRTFETTGRAWDSNGLGMDNTIAYDQANNCYHEVSKNGPNELIEQRRATNVGKTWTLVKNQIGQGAAPALEGPLIFKDIKDPTKWHMWADNYQRGSGYLPFETNNVMQADWKVVTKTLPANPRHGYVVPITAEERANIVSAG